MLKISNVVLDFRLSVHNIVGLLDFDWLFNTSVVQARLVLVLWDRHVLEVGLVGRAGRCSVVLLMKHNEVVAPYWPALPYLQWNALNWLLESVGRQSRFASARFLASRRSELHLDRLVRLAVMLVSALSAGLIVVFMIGLPAVLLRIYTMWVLSLVAKHDVG